MAHQQSFANREGCCVEAHGNNELSLGTQNNYKFDQVFQDNSEQSAVYDECVKGLVKNCFEGYNAAILAYGQTGSKLFVKHRREDLYHGNFSKIF